MRTTRTGDAQLAGLRRRAIRLEQFPGCVDADRGGRGRHSGRDRRWLAADPLASALVALMILPRTWALAGAHSDLGAGSGIGQAPAKPPAGFGAGRPQSDLGQPVIDGRAISSCRQSPHYRGTPVTDRARVLIQKTTTLTAAKAAGQAQFQRDTATLVHHHRQTRSLMPVRRQMTRI